MYLFNVDKFFRCIDFIPNKGKDINSPYFEIKGIPGIKQTKLYIYICYIVEMIRLTLKYIRY